MPVIALIISSVAFWGLYWFVKMGGINHLRERLDQRRTRARSARVHESQRIAPLSAIDDPREAAIVLMLLIARGGDPTADQIVAIEDTMRRVFEFNSDVEERLTQARFAANCAQGFADAAGVFSNLLNKQLTVNERHELVGMVEDIAKIDGPSAIQTDNIDLLRRKIKLSPT